MIMRLIRVFCPFAPQGDAGYDPRRSNVKEDALADFIRAPITGELREVSGR